MANPHPLTLLHHLNNLPKQNPNPNQEPFMEMIKKDTSEVTEDISDDEEALPEPDLKTLREISMPP